MDLSNDIISMSSDDSIIILANQLSSQELEKMATITDESPEKLSEDIKANNLLVKEITVTKHYVFKDSEKFNSEHYGWLLGTSTQTFCIVETN